MTLVVIGGGLAGGTAVTELREQGYDGELVLFAAEEHLPYERPPLSKGYLLGKDPLDVAFVHDAEWYAEHDVDVRRSTTVTGIDLESHNVRTDRSTQSYDKLLLATGAQPRRLQLADDSDAPVAYLRTIEHSDRLKRTFAEGVRVVIIGAGWIGLEVAAASREAGSEVTIFESAAQPLLGVLGPEIGRVFADLHRSHGVDLRLGTSVSAQDLTGADLVVVGIGAVPDTTLAEASGLEVDNGVLVDERLRTSHPDVFAAGDIANQLHPRLGRRIRVEHWDNAIEQGKVAARNLLGSDQSYERMPYFFTDQYDLGMEYVGHVGPDGYDRVVVQGDTAAAFRAFWVKDETVVAGMHANDWDAIDEIRERVGRDAAGL
jgi:3-phenylpropionate/trans-cinnamate dioxygenase ferredoxin reductase component